MKSINSKLSEYQNEVRKELDQQESQRYRKSSFIFAIITLLISFISIIISLFTDNLTYAK